MAITKAQIAEAIRSTYGFTKAESQAHVEKILGIIKESLAAGEDVLISGFGKFQVRTKQARPGRNPYTGESLTLKSRKVVTFKWSGKLKDRINP